MRYAVVAKWLCRIGPAGCLLAAGCEAQEIGRLAVSSLQSFVMGMINMGVDRLFQGVFGV